jgi:hypothetical protein
VILLGVDLVHEPQVHSRGRFVRHGAGFITESATLRVGNGAQIAV